MPSNTSTMENLLKDDIEPSIQYLLNDATPELDLFDKDDSPWEGKQKLIDVHVGRNRGSYSPGEGGIPPTAGRQQLEQLKVPRRYQYGQIQITKQLMLASRSNKGSFARGMRLETDRLVKDMKIERSFGLWGDGRGIRAFINGAANSVTQTLDAPGGVAGAINGSRFINVGDWIATVSNLTGAISPATAYEVVDVPAAGTTMVLSAALNSTDNFFVVKSGQVTGTVVANNTDWNHKPMGLLGLVDDGTYVNLYFGLSRTQFPMLQSTVISNVGAMSADALQIGIDTVYEKSGAILTDLLARPEVLRAYLTISENDRRYTGGDLKNPDVGTALAKKGWQTGISFGDIPFRRCMDQPYGTVFGVSREGMTHYVEDPGSWIDDDGSILYRSTTAVDTFDATYRIFENFVHLAPNTCLRMEGITTNIVVIHRV